MTLLYMLQACHLQQLMAPWDPCSLSSLASPTSASKMWCTCCSCLTLSIGASHTPPTTGQACRLCFSSLMICWSLGMSHSTAGYPVLCWSELLFGLRVMTTSTALFALCSRGRTIPACSQSLTVCMQAAATTGRTWTHCRSSLRCVDGLLVCPQVCCLQRILEGEACVAALPLYFSRSVMPPYLAAQCMPKLENRLALVVCLIALHAGCTGKGQPCDVGVQRPMKVAFDEYSMEVGIL